MWRERLKQPENIVGGVLCVVALGMLCYRLANLDLAPFIMDEPIELNYARQFLQKHELPSFTPESGSQGVRYGPTTMWFDEALQLVTNATPETNIFAQCLLLTLAHLALCFALARTFKIGLIGLATLIAWVGSSPYHFFWSRLAWDPLNTFAALTLAVAIGLPMGTWRSALLLGALMGLSFSLHLLFVPFVVIIGLWFAWQHRESVGAFAKGPLVAAGAMVAVTSPYLFYLVTKEQFHTPPTGFQTAVLETHVVMSFRLATWSGLEYLFDGDWPTFKAWLGSLAPILDWSFLVIVGAVIALAGIVLALRSTEVVVRRVGALAAVILLVYPLYFTWRQLSPHPHYHCTTWWVVPLGIASIFAWLRPRRRVFPIAFTSFIWVISVVQVAFLVTWMTFIRERNGTLGIHYSTPIGLQRKAVQAVCSLPAPQIYLRNETIIFDHGLQYVVSTEPKCEGKQVVVGKGGGPGALVRLGYTRPGAPDLGLALPQ